MKAPKFITVTTQDGTEALINITAIAAMCKQPAGSTRIFLFGGSTMDVTESFKDIQSCIVGSQGEIRFSNYDKFRKAIGLE